MRKETFAEKLARKSFESATIQKSWQTHIKAFGPILEPAFVENYQARLDLTAALNFISNREIEKGLKKLQLIENACFTDEDKAAWLFCMGLCLEMANVKEDMIAYYQEAGEYGHRFYLPYLKIAKTAHNDAVFEIAEENYIKAIQCLIEDKWDEHKCIILGSAYTNYASCLTMMHRYEEAEEALRKSIEVLPEQRGRAATEAILQAAMGNAEKASYYTDIIAVDMPAFYEHTQKMVHDILEKRHPHFSLVELSKDAMDAFWEWFLLNEENLLKKLELNEYDTVFYTIQPKLKEVFPFMERDLEFGIEPRNGFYQITFADFFVVSLEQGYKELIEIAPKALAEHWGFDIAR